MKWIKKDCAWCLKNWWDGRRYITRACKFHQRYNYEYLLKELKNWKLRMLFLTFVSVILFVQGIFDIEKDRVLEMSVGWVAVISAIFFIIFISYFWANIKKSYRKQIGNNKWEKYF